MPLAEKLERRSYHLHDQDCNTNSHAHEGTRSKEQLRSVRFCGARSRLTATRFQAAPAPSHFAHSLRSREHCKPRSMRALETQNHKAGFICPPAPQTPARPAEKTAPRAGPTKSRAPKRPAGRKATRSHPVGALACPELRAPKVVLLGYICPIPSTTCDNTPAPQWVTRAAAASTAGRPGPLQIHNPKPPPHGPWPLDLGPTWGV
jgi:hypothetical protein